MNKISVYDVWKDYLDSVKCSVSLMKFYIAEIVYDHMINHDGYVNGNGELICNYGITKDQIRMSMLDKINSMTKPAHFLFFFLKGESGDDI
jgi:hypothetical protein